MHRARRAIPVRIGALIAVALLATGGGATAADVLPASQGGPDRKPVQPSASFDRQLNAIMARAADSVRASRASRSTSQRVGARQQARRSFAGQSAAEALATAKSKHPEVVDTPPFRPLALSGDQRIAGFSGNYAARIENAGPRGNRTILRTSPLPLRADNGDGARPVDLSLLDEGDAFTPKNPIEPVRIFKNAAEGVSFAGGFSLAPAISDDVQGTLNGASVFYANIAPDTDWIARPDPLGAETHYQLRSSSSPSQMRMSVGLPQGASLRQGTDGGIAVVKGEDTLGAIASPISRDADKVTVPTTMRVDGSDIVIEVDLAGRDVAYPIAVDPTISAGFFFTFQGDDAFSYWQWFDSTGTGYGSTTGKFQRFGGNAYLGRGLYINVPEPGRTFTGYGGLNGSAEKGFWFYRAPGRAHITHVRMNYSTNDVPASLQLCDFFGIANADISAFEGASGNAGTGPRAVSEGCTPNSGFGDDFYSSAPYDGSQPGNTFLLGEYAYGSGQFYGTSYFRDAQIDMVDYDTPSKPTIATTQIPPAYIASSDDPITARATDPSLGVQSFVFHGPSAWSGNGRRVGTNCPYGPCPQNASVTTPVDNMPDGQQTVSVTADDGLGHIIDSERLSRSS